MIYSVNDMGEIRYSIDGGVEQRCSFTGLQGVLKQQFVGCSTKLKVTFPSHSGDDVCVLDGPIYIYSKTLIDFNGWVFTRRGEEEGGPEKGHEMLIGKGKSSEIGDDMAGNCGYDYLEKITLMNGTFKINTRNTKDDSIARFPHGNYITLYNMKFMGQKTKHQVVFAGCANVTIKQCVFDGELPQTASYVGKHNYEALHLDWIGADGTGKMSEGYGACTKAYHSPSLTPNEKKGADGTTCRQVFVTDSRFVNVMSGMGSHDGYAVPASRLSQDFEVVDGSETLHLGSVGEDYTIQNCYFKMFHRMYNIMHHTRVYIAFTPFQRIVSYEGMDDYVKYNCRGLQEGEKKYYPVCMSVIYRAHIQTTGTQSWVKDGEYAGTIGLSKRIEGIQIKIDTNLYQASSTQGGEPEEYENMGDIGIIYKSHIQGTGWENSWKRDGELSGTTGESRRLEAIRMKLTGALAEKYDIYYRAHVQNYGWLAWASNDQIAGSIGLSKRMEAIQIVLVPEDGIKPDVSPMNNYYGIQSEQNVSCVTA